MTPLMSSAASLDRARRQLIGMRFEGRKEVSRLMALAECNFRRAVHPETPARDAIERLQETIRLDGSNPKYAYHLGRIYFLQGKFQEASRWFRLACCLAPTSHRIWAHVAVLLEELNAVYHGNENYEPNVLATRAKTITQAIQAGEDNIDVELLDFVPPKSRAVEEEEKRQGQGHRERSSSQTRPVDDIRPSSNVRRYLHAKKCRWSGVDDLLIERILQGRPTQANVRLIVPILQELTERSCRRRGGPAAVAILCTQWLCAGYPVETVRRIMQALPAVLPSWEFLDRVCRIFESPAPDVAPMIVAAVETGCIPPVVAAMIHRQRLLWQPLEYRSLGSYRAARALIAENRSQNGSRHNAQDHNDGDADEHQLESARNLIRRLDRAIGSLSGSPPKKLKDELPKQGSGAEKTDPQALLARFSAFEEAADTLIRLKDEGFRLIKDQIDNASKNLSTADVFNQTTADHRAAQQFVACIASTTETCLNEFQTLSRDLPDVEGIQLPEDFATRCEDCISMLQGASNFGKFSKVLKRIEKRLTSVAAGFPENQSDPAAEWAALLAGTKAALSGALEVGCTNQPEDSLADRLQSMEQIAIGLEEARAGISEFLRVSLEPAATDESDPQILSQTLADREFCESLLKALATGGELGLSKLELLAERLVETTAADLPDNYDVRLEETRNRFRAATNLGSLHRRLQRIDRKLTDATKDIQAIDCHPCAELQQWNEQIERTAFPDKAAVESDSVEPAAENTPQAETNGNGTTARPVAQPPRPPKPDDQMTVIDQLEYTLVRTDWSINQSFTDALATFEHYPDWVLVLPPFESIRRKIFGQLAETMYRLGRRKTARSIWNRMLRTNRLDVDALKNIAICDTAEGDVGRSLTSWREYLELLYLFDVLAGTPRPNAQLRAEFHRAFGNAYAPAFLSASFDHEWKDMVDPAALIAFLSSPGRFRSFVNHRLLEYLNTRFVFDSPSLVLGIKRVEAESRTDDAETTMTEFVNTVETLIPGRVAGQFAQLAKESIREAAEKCRETSRMTMLATPSYDEEVTRQIELLSRMFDLKIKLVVAFREHVNMVKNITSFNFLRELMLLDAIPLKLSPGLFPIVASTLRVDPDMLEDLTASLRSNVIVGLIEYLLADDDPAERPIRQRQYQLVTGSWLKHPDFADVAKWIDTPPPQLMPNEAQEAFEGNRVEAVLKYLRQWHDDYPAMAGLSVLIANQLFKLKEFDEARRRLEASRKLVFHEPTRRHIHYLLVQILIRDIEPLLEQEAYEPALDIGLKMVRLDDFQSALVCQTLQLYMAVSSRKGHGFRSDEVNQAVNAWLQRADALAAQSEDENSPFPRPTADDLEQVRKQYEEAETHLTKLPN